MPSRAYNPEHICAARIRVSGRLPTRACRNAVAEDGALCWRHGNVSRHEREVLTGAVVEAALVYWRAKQSGNLDAEIAGAFDAACSAWDQRL
jgi:hypothetical protein